MLIPLVTSLAIGILLRHLEIPILRRRILGSERYPCLILVEVGFTVGLIVILIAPAGLLFPDGRTIWIAAILAGLSLIAITGVAALCLVQLLKIGSETLFVGIAQEAAGSVFLARALTKVECAAQAHRRLITSLGAQFPTRRRSLHKMGARAGGGWRNSHDDQK